MSSPHSSPTERPLRADARRNREANLAAARVNVAERGTEAQIQDVAREAGVGVGTVYRHFPTKDALMGELMAQCMRENAEIGREAELLDDPWEAFASMVRNGCESMARDVAKRRMWTVASDEAFAHAAEAKEAMQAQASAVIERARAAGVLRSDFTVADMPILMHGMGAVIDQPGQDWRRIVEFTLDGLRVR